MAGEGINGLAEPVENHNIEPLPISPLSTQIDASLNKVVWPAGYSIKRVESTEERLSMTTGHDYRTSVEEQMGVASVFRGVDFDPEKIRTQEFAITREGRNIGVMTVAICPKWSNEQARYLQRTEDGQFGIITIQDLTGGVAPDFLIVPAFLELNENERGNGALTKAMINSEKAIMAICSKNAPRDSLTYIQMSAQADLTYAEIDSIRQMVQAGKLEISETLSSRIGKPRHESRAAVTLACHLGIPAAPNVASIIGGGPVFMKKA
jgi:hypothetical protein